MVETGAPERKEKVLHTRIPATLDDALKRFARSMRVPVSNAVRVLLEDAVEVAQRASDTVVLAADRATERMESLGAPARPARATRAQPIDAEARPDPLAGVFGYQPLILGVQAACARCESPIEVGQDAFLGLRDTAGPRVFVCTPCLPRAQKQGDPHG